MHKSKKLFIFIKKLKSNIMKKTADGFIWLIVTNKAKEVWNSGLFELYILHEDDSESLITEYIDLCIALEDGLDIGIEVGHLD